MEEEELRYPRQLAWRLPDLDEFEKVWEFDFGSFEFFLDLGFDEMRSWLMAVQGCNHGRAENLTQKHCSHEQAFAILF